MLKYTAVVICFLFSSSIEVSAEVTESDLREARKLVDQEHASMKAYRFNPDWVEVIDSETLEKFNRVLDLPLTTKWFQEKGCTPTEKNPAGMCNSYRPEIEPHQITLEYSESSLGAKLMVDREVDLQEQRKESYEENPNRQALDLLDQEMNQREESQKISKEYYDKLVMDRAEFIANEREASELEMRLKAEQEAMRERVREGLAQQRTSELGAQTASTAQRSAPSQNNDENGTGVGHFPNFEEEKAEILRKMKANEPLDGDRLERMIKILDGTG
ncbi:MAG: hypothetical protein R3F50_11410 [Gammaproteobacteria bacterium]